MAKKGYILDDNLHIREKTLSVWAKVKTVLRYFIGSLSLAVLYYIIFCLFISTDTEKKFRDENRMFSKVYPEMKETDRILSQEIEGLEFRDAEIYEDVFTSPSPSLGKLSDMDFLNEADTLPNRDIVEFTSTKAVRLCRDAGRIEDNFREIFDTLASYGVKMPPMSFPVDDISFAKVGASTGTRMSPFYKVPTYHDGIDIMSSGGSAVRAAADGVVSKVVHSRKGRGNIVCIEHGGGYSTTYAHLADIKVSKGRVVKRGTVIGTVGMSGNTFVPHLHYQVQKDTLVVDPVNYFFADLSPDEYANLMYMSVNTGKSMD